MPCAHFSNVFNSKEHIFIDQIAILNNPKTPDLQGGKLKDNCIN